jgi:hypothetical protein
MRTENDVFATFCDCLDYAREDMGIDSSWNVIARAQQAMVNVDKIILVDKIDEVQKGFSNTRFEMQLDGRLHEIWEWVEEWKFQISCVRERRIDDSTVTVTADHVAACLKAWFNSQDGADYLREHEIAPLLVKGIIPQQYPSENEMYQRYVHFDVVVQAVMSEDRTPPVVSAIELGIKHVPECNGSESGEPEYEPIWTDESN